LAMQSTAHRSSPTTRCTLPTSRQSSRSPPNRLSSVCGLNYFAARRSRSTGLVSFARPGLFRRAVSVSSPARSTSGDRAVFCVRLARSCFPCEKCFLTCRSPAVVGDHSGSVDRYCDAQSQSPASSARRSTSWYSPTTIRTVPAVMISSCGAGMKSVSPGRRSAAIRNPVSLRI